MLPRYRWSYTFRYRLRFGWNIPFLRKRALVSDVIAHATLPGVGVAFIIMIWLGGDGRSLLGLLFGSAITALIGLFIIEWIPRRTRLPEDAAIGVLEYFLVRVLFFSQLFRQ